MEAQRDSRQYDAYQRMLIIERLCRVRRRELRVELDRLRFRLLMPGARAVDEPLYRAHVRELMARAANGDSLESATEAEVLLALERQDGQLNPQATKLKRFLDAKVRRGEEGRIPDRLLFDRLRHLVNRRPRPKRRLDQLLLDQSLEDTSG
ncbi:MAG: hypothetical protein D6775_14780, partial [Caldilineae bacterium]